MKSANSYYQSYPVFSDDVTIYEYKYFGVLDFTKNGKKIKVDKDILTFLLKCSGDKNIEEILNSKLLRKNSFDTSIIILTKLLQLFSQKAILLHSSPTTNSFNIIDRTAAHYPDSVHIELTSVCNLECSYCYRESGPNVANDFIPKEKLFNIVDDLSDRNLTVVELSGGEPLLHPDIIEIVRYCIHKLELVSIITNGTLITKELINEIIPFKDKVILSVSLDNYSSEKHDKYSGVDGSFDKTIMGIQLLVENDVRFRVSMAVDETNWNDIEETILFAKQLGATYFGYSPIIPYGRAKDSFSMWNLDAKEIISTEIYLEKKYNDFIFYPEKHIREKVLKPGGCGAGHRSYVIGPNGDVRICATFDANSGIVGSLFNQTPEEVFESRASFLTSIITPPTQEICKSCKYTTFCMGCILRGFSASGWIGIKNCHWRKNKNVNEFCEIIERN